MQVHNFVVAEITIDLIRLVFGKSIPEKTFVTNVLSFFIDRDMLESFLQILREIDPKMVHSRKYLEYSCQYLEKEGLQPQLMAIQVEFIQFAQQLTLTFVAILGRILQSRQAKSRTLQGKPGAFSKNPFLDSNREELPTIFKGSFVTSSQTMITIITIFY